MTLGTAYGRKMASRPNRRSRARGLSRISANSRASPSMDGIRIAPYTSTRADRRPELGVGEHGPVVRQSGEHLGAGAPAQAQPGDLHRVQALPDRVPDREHEQDDEQDDRRSEEDVRHPAGCRTLPPPAGWRGRPSVLPSRRRSSAETVKPFFFMSSTVAVCIWSTAAANGDLSVIALAKASLYVL